MFPLKKATAGQKVYVRLTDSSDHFTAEPGITSPTLTLSKNGGALGAMNDGTWVELAGGLYTIQLDATDTNTAGPFVIRVVKTGCDDAFVLGWIGTDLDQVIEGTLTMRELIRIIAAVQAGKTSINGLEVKFRDTGDTKDRLIAGMTGSQRVLMTLDGS